MKMLPSGPGAARLLMLNIAGSFLFAGASVSVAASSAVPPSAKVEVVAAPKSDELVPLVTSSIPLSHNDNNLSIVGKLRYMGGLKITSPLEKFGGISGVVISADGRQLMGISDSSNWLLADIIYDSQNRLSGLANGRMAPVRDLKNNKEISVQDAEAVTAVPGAGYVVSFESPHSLRYFQADRPDHYDSLFMADAQKINFAPNLPNDYESLPDNLGIEALTTMNDGRMLAFSENTVTRDGRSLAQGWLIGHGKITELSYDITPSFKPTDMATLPNGDVLVLERHFSLARGMASRVTRLPAMAINSGQVIKGELIAELAYPLNMDNMEALAVRQNEKGEIFVYIMSDNNFNRMQRNLMLMFRLEG